MMSIRLYLKQILATAVSASLIGATAPLPSPAATNALPVALHKQVRPIARRLAKSTSAGSLSAMVASDPSPVFQPASKIANILSAPSKGVASIAQSESPKPAAIVHASNPQQDRKLVGQATALHNHGLAFVENRGQFDPRVKFRVSNHGKTLWLTENGITFDFLRNKSLQDDSLASEGKSSLASVGASRIGDARRSEQPSVPVLDRQVISQEFVGTHRDFSIDAKSVQDGAYNYFSGSDSSKWRTQVRRYSEVVYHELWKGIDLRLYGNGPDLEQEFLVESGADVSQLRVAYKGIDRLEVDQDGSLLVHTAAGQMRESTPRIFQEISGRRVVIKGSYKLLTATSYTFNVSAYDAKYALVIDPTLLYSTYLGGSAGNNFFTSNQEVANAVAVDASGNAYITGYTLSSDFPITVGAFDTTHAPVGSYVGFVTKLNPTGSALIYSSYFDYTSLGPVGIAVNAEGNAYITGLVNGINSNNVAQFPLTSSAYDQCHGITSNGTISGFLSELSPNGSDLVYSTCFGSFGFDGVNVPIRSLTIDTLGRAFVVGAAPSGGGVPTTPNAFQSSILGVGSAFVTEFDTTAAGASSLVYSTYLGPSLAGSTAVGTGVAVDTFGKIYVAGLTLDGFPVTPGAFQTVFPPCIRNGAVCPTSEAAFIAKLDPSASGAQSLIYATYLGGLGSTAAFAIAVDSSGAAYVTGDTSGSYYQSFPITPGAFLSTVGQNAQAGFVTKLNAAGSGLVYSTLLSGNSPSVGNGILVDALGNAYVAGYFRAGGPANPFFPVTPDAFQSSFTKLSGDFSEAFLTKLNPTGSALLYSSYLGGEGDDVATGIGVDQPGDAYVVGHTSSGTFPVTPGAFQPVRNGTGDAFVTKFPVGSTFRALDISPKSGGNTGVVTITLYGGGFHNGVSLVLTGGGVDIPASSVAIGASGLTVDATFDLHGAVPGLRDLVVKNSDGATAVLPAEFTVTGGGAPDLTLDLLVPRRVVDGQFTDFYVTISNKGNVNAVGVPFWLAGIPGAWDLALVSELAQVPTLANQPKLDLSNVPVVIDTQTAFGKVVPLFISSIAAGGALTLHFRVRPTIHAADAFLAAWINSPYFHSPLDPNVARCLDTVLSSIVSRIIGSFPVGQCVQDLTDLTSQLFAAGVAGQPNVVFSSIGFYTAIIKSTVHCGIAANPEAAVISSVIKFFEDASDVSTITSVLVDCASVFLQVVQRQVRTTAVTSLDPNDIEGVIGIGPQQYVSGNQTLSYAVYFDNAPTAGAAARTIVVTNHLDNGLDLNTLKLGNVIINGNEIPLSNFEAKVGLVQAFGGIDLRPNQPLVETVSATLDLANRNLTWSIASLDTTTGLPPSDPALGLLPPGSLGNVNYSARPLPTQPTGSTILGQATIVFDANAPMDTSAWINTLDNTPPTSQAGALPATEPAAGFTVAWSGTDIGAGIQDFTVYVSDNGSPFTPFQVNTTATSAAFTGQVGHTYGFYSIARDLVGNVEAPKSAAEATTQVALFTDATPPVTTATVSPGPNGSGWTNTNVGVTLTSVDNSGGSGVKQITYSATGAQTMATTVLAGASTSFSITAEGITTITLFGTDNAGNVEASKTLVVRIDKTPPSMTGSRTPAANANGWNNSPITVNFQCADALSGLAAGSPPAPTVLSTQGAGQSVSGTCTDIAGNAASATVQGVNIDFTPPILAITANPHANSNGWNNSDVTVSFAAVDTLSGVAAVIGPITVTAEGAGQVVPGSATDLAGNLTTGSTTISLDKTPPEVFNQFDPQTNDIVLFGRDSLSGVAPGPVQPISVVTLGRGDDDGDDMGCPDGDAVQKELRTYQIFDLAGNPVVLIEKVKRRGQLLRAKIISIQYGNGPVTTVLRNRESFDWTLAKDGTLKELDQEFRIAPNWDGSRVEADFDARTNQTIVIQQVPKPKSKVVKPGLDLLRMATSVGNLSIEF